jgi:RNA polymerase sigma factor (sigma-70 family)
MLPTTDAAHQTHQTQNTQDGEFSDFYRDSVVPLVRFLVVLGARPPDATDIAQETMIKAHRDWATINHPHAWVREVASRAWGQQMARVHEDPVEQVPEHTSLLPPVNDIDTLEQRHDLLRLLATLPPRQRQVMAWHLDGYTDPEIAKKLDIDASAVRSSRYKARRALAAHLAGKGGPR